MSMPSRLSNYLQRCGASYDLCSHPHSRGDCKITIADDSPGRSKNSRQRCANRSEQ